MEQEPGCTRWVSVKEAISSDLLPCSKVRGIIVPKLERYKDMFVRYTTMQCTHLSWYVATAYQYSILIIFSFFLFPFFFLLMVKLKGGEAKDQWDRSNNGLVSVESLFIGPCFLGTQKYKLVKSEKVQGPLGLLLCFLFLFNFS